MGYKDPEQRRKYARKWLAARRDAWFADKVCAECGSTDRLELDHIDPSSKVSHRIWSWRAERRQAELNKCRALCYTCHLEKSNNEKQRGNQRASSLLREEDIPFIRSTKEPLRIVADRFGVSIETIKSVRKRESWKHVP